MKRAPKLLPSNAILVPPKPRTLSTPEGDLFMVTLWSLTPPSWTLYLDSSRHRHGSHFAGSDTRSAKLRASTIRVDGVAILKERERMTKGTMEDVGESHTLPRHCQRKPSFQSRLAGSGRCQEPSLGAGHRACGFGVEFDACYTGFTIPLMGVQNGARGWGSNFRNW